MTRSAFINEVVDDVTEGKSIPASPKPDRVKTIIDRALKYFKEQDDEGVEFEYAILRIEAFQTELFKSRRQIQMPSCVESVTSVKRMGNVLGGRSTEVDPDYRKTNLNFGIANTGNSRDMLTGVTHQFYQDFMGNFNLRTVGYEYNSHTHMLTIVGRDPIESMIAELYVHLPDEGYFEMDRFFRYVTGKCKESFATTFDFIKQKTIGGREINVSQIRSDGKELIKEVKDELKAQKESVDFWTEY